MHTWSKPHTYGSQDFDECLALIEQVLGETENLCEYALFTKALIKRQNGARKRVPACIAWKGAGHVSQGGRRGRKCVHDTSIITYLLRPCYSQPPSALPTRSS